jgi:heat shock protein HslJ
MAAAGFRTALFALALGGCTSIAADKRTFDGTRWHVTAINGRSTPVAGDYPIEFRNGGIGGRFGCNQFGGRYAVAGETMTTSDVASTLMGCPEPAASLETQGFAILHQPMRWTWISGLKLTLRNSAGSIALERAN